MEWIKLVLPLIGVALGWLLSESGKMLTDRRLDKRKLKKLLFFLLELRYHFARQLSNEQDLEKFIGVFLAKVADKFQMDKSSPELSLGLEQWKPILEKATSKMKASDEKFDYLSENIDRILIELAEIFPVLAYELSGRHNIKERLGRVDDYFNEIGAVTDEIPFDVRKWINPKLTENLLSGLDEGIDEIAKKIDRRTFLSSKEKIDKMNFKEDDTELNKFIDEYLQTVSDNDFFRQ